jgi:uncharacterized protein
MPQDIEIHESAEIEGATIVIGFPGVGFSSPIATNYLVKQLEMEQVGHVVSSDFPPVASVHSYVPQHPMRIYQKGPLVVIMMEFAPSGDLVRPLGLHILEWAFHAGAKRLIVLDTLTPDNVQALMEDRSIYSVGTTERDRADLEEAELEQVEEGMITGMSGVLLSEGAAIGVPVVGIMSEAHPMFPDVRAAVRLLQEGAKLEPGLEVNLEELEANASEVERAVKDQLSQAQQLMDARMQGTPEGAIAQAQKPPQYMYG